MLGNVPRRKRDKNSRYNSVRFREKKSDLSKFS